jgi:hypothetical protein
MSKEEWFYVKENLEKELGREPTPEEVGEAYKDFISFKIDKSYEYADLLNDKRRDNE